MAETAQSTADAAPGIQVDDRYRSWRILGFSHAEAHRRAEIEKAWEQEAKEAAARAG